MLELQRYGCIQDSNLRRHAIDTRLGRHDAALAHLVAAGPEHFEAALALARRHGLMRQARCILCTSLICSALLCLLALW